MLGYRLWCGALARKPLKVYRITWAVKTTGAESDVIGPGKDGDAMRMSRDFG